MSSTALRTGSVEIPEGARQDVPPTEPAAQDAALAELRQGAERWASLALDDRIAALDAVRRSAARVAERWAHAGCRLKGIPIGTPAEAEEWLSGPYSFLRAVVLLARSLKDVRDRGRPGLPGVARQRPNGRIEVPVYPTDPLDRILFRGLTAWARLEEGAELGHLERSMAALYRQDRIEPRVSLVLGAGNVSSIGPLDALHRLFTEGEVVLLKMNPVNAAMGPVLEEALRPLVDLDALRIAYGGAEVGARLCAHEGVDTIHVTGSDRTHDAIVWGSGEEGRERKRRGEPLNDRPITSELGNVSPVIVVPGPWSKRDLVHHGRGMAASLTTNAGFNCNATRVLVTHAGWDQREAFLAEVREALRTTPDRVPYYPGAEDRHAAFLAEHPGAFTTGASGPGHVPWTLIDGVDPARSVDVCFQTEAWCGIMAETALPAGDPVEFLRKAVQLANTTLWGTLNVTLLVHPASMRDPDVRRAVSRAEDELRYGTVSTNVWAAVSFVLGSTPWGAYPGHTLDDVQSGIGSVHNTYLIDRPEKTVLRAPFRMVPEPPWFHTKKNGHVVARRLTELTAEVTFLRLARTLAAAVGLAR
ncbi:MAG: aldehyde dehydrogenase family protein [Planctomycetota bacterium]